MYTNEKEDPVKGIKILRLSKYIHLLFWWDKLHPHTDPRFHRYQITFKTAICNKQVAVFLSSKYLFFRAKILKIFYIFLLLLKLDNGSKNGLLIAYTVRGSFFFPDLDFEKLISDFINTLADKPEMEKRQWKMRQDHLYKQIISGYIKVGLLRCRAVPICSIKQSMVDCSP